MRGFDVAQDYRGLKEVAQRSAFLVDGHGIIRGRWSYETAEVPDFDELLAALASVS